MKKILSLMLIGCTFLSIFTTKTYAIHTYTWNKIGFNLPQGSPATSNLRYLRLKLAKDAKTTEDVVVQFKTTASPNYVFNEDAPYMRGFGNVNLWTFSSDNVPLAINVLPLPGLKPDTIRLDVEAKTGGTLQFTLEDINAVPQLFDVWLMDKYAKDSLDMRQNKTYSFNVNKKIAASFGPNRFALVVRQNMGYAYRLLGFSANKIQDTKSEVEVQWNTTYEGDYTRFTVERSNNDGKTFSVLDSERAADIGVYNFVDTNPKANKNLYRLKQEDINDSISYSNTVSVLFPEQNTGIDNSLNIYPNPAINLINLAIIPQSPGNTQYEIKIMDGSGKMVNDATSATLSWQGSISKLRPGIYFIQVFNNKTQSLVGKTKFVKL